MLAQSAGCVRSMVVRHPSAGRPGRPRPVIRILGPLLALASVAVLAGCGAADTDGATTSTIGATQIDGVTDGGVLSIAVPATPRSWSPTSEWTTSELQAARGVYDRLMVRDADGRVVPELAERVTSASNHSVWTIALRPDVVFADGTPLDALTVAVNLEAQMRAPANRGLLDPIASVTVASSSVVTVTMFSPWSTFPEVLATRVGTIASVTTLNGGAPVGTGPFSFGRVDEDGTVVLVHNQSYWRRGLPRLDEVRLVPIPDPNERIDAVLSGRVQMVAVDEPRQLSRLDGIPDRDARIVLHEDRNAERPKVNIAFETGRAPFDRISARRAVALATDRSEILEKVFDNQGTVARGMISDTSPWFTDQGGQAKDLARAREQVAAYTQETGLPLSFRLLVPPDTTLLRVASLWRLQLSLVGIDISVEEVDPASAGFVAATGQFQSMLQIGFDAVHPDAYFPLFRGIPAEQSVISTNVTRYVNPLVTKALVDARSTVDSARQVDDYRIVQEQIAIDVPYLFLVQVRQVIVTTPNVRDVTAFTTASGAEGLGQDDATVSLAQLRLAG